MNLLRSSSVQLPPEPTSAWLYGKPLACPLGPPTTPKRLGPTLFAPPWVRVWHCSHFLATSAPAFGSAEARSGAIGSSGCSPPAPAAASPLASTPGTT